MCQAFLVNKIYHTLDQLFSIGSPGQGDEGPPVARHSKDRASVLKEATGLLEIIEHVPQNSNKNKD